MISVAQTSLSPAPRQRLQIPNVCCYFLEGSAWLLLLLPVGHQRGYGGAELSLDRAGRIRAWNKKALHLNRGTKLLQESEIRGKWRGKWWLRGQMRINPSH